MDTPNSKPSDSNFNISLTVSSTGSTLSESSLNDFGGRTPDLISSSSANESSSSFNTTTSSYGSSVSRDHFRMSNYDFRSHGSRASESYSPYQTIFEDSASLNSPSIIVSPPIQEDGFTPSPSTNSERIPHQRQRTSLAERLLSLVDSNGRPIRLVKRSTLKDITNIAKQQPRSFFVPGNDDECIEDAQCLVYRSAEEFLPTFASSPPTCNAPYSDSSSGLFGSSSSRFGDMFFPDALSSSSTAVAAPTFSLPKSFFKLAQFAGPNMTRMNGNIVTSLVAKYQNEYLDDDENDDGGVVGEQFEWEDEMRSLELGLGFFDEKK